MSKVKSPRRSEKAGIANFSKEMVSAFLMAFVFIVYIIQAFKIPTGSMENSLLAGDFLLGLKFIYGAPVLPFSYTKFPGVSKPKPGDVVIFKYPGADAKDYIKRCIAGPGQTIEIKQRKVYVDDKLLIPPPQGKYLRNGVLPIDIMNFSKLKIPAKGDTLYPGKLPIREFMFCKHLIHQENPELSFPARVQNTPLIRNIFPHKPGKERVVMKFFVYVNDTYVLQREASWKIDDWTILANSFTQMKEQLLREYKPIDTLSDSLAELMPDIEIRKAIFLDGKKVDKYIVKNDNYFMMGDNRDNSLDSRYWGYLNRNFVKAKAFILYFSWAKNYEYLTGEEKLYSKSTYKYSDGSLATIKDSPEKLWGAFMDIHPRPGSNRKWNWNDRGELTVGKTRHIPPFFLPLKIRWNRIGKLIRGWDGLKKEKK